MALPRPPVQLVRGALEDPELGEVLADWYETQGETRWAAMLRDTIRWGDVRGALKAAGLSLRRTESPFFWLPDAEPSLGMQHLGWQVRDPGWLEPLLATPLWNAVRSVHLVAWRPRTAVPTVLEALASRPLTTLEVAGQAIDPTNSPRTLRRLHCRLARDTHRAPLPVRELALQIATDGDLARLERLETPELKILHLRAVRGRRGAERDVRRALDRPLHTITVDRTCANRFGAALAARAPERLIDVDRRWHRVRDDPDRWLVDG